MKLVDTMGDATMDFIDEANPFASKGENKEIENPGSTSLSQSAQPVLEKYRNQSLGTGTDNLERYSYGFAIPSWQRISSELRKFPKDDSDVAKPDPTSLQFEADCVNPSWFPCREQELGKKRTNENIINLGLDEGKKKHRAKVANQSCIRRSTSDSWPQSSATNQVIDRNTDEAGKYEVLVRYRRHGKSSWGKWRNIFVIAKRCNRDFSRIHSNSHDVSKITAECQTWTFKLDNDQGTFRVHTDILSRTQQERIAKDLSESPYYRQYMIQGGPEPRVHFSLHEDATDDFNE